MAILLNAPGLPGKSSTRTTSPRRVFKHSEGGMYLPVGKGISGTYSRDSGNTGSLDVLRPGLPMGKRTSGGLYAPAILGVLQNAEVSTSTQLEVTAAQAVEIARRVGTSGTLKVTGPPTASGTVRTLTATYSAIDTSTGAITITAMGVNEVQTVNLVTAATAGNLRLIVQKTDGTYALTPNIAYSATDATLLSNAQTALDTATGVTNGIVATAIAATDTDLGMVLTYSGTGYAANTWALAQVHTLFTSNTGANVVRTTTGVDARFIAGSWVQPTDGSETILTFIDDVANGGTGIKVTDNDASSIDVAFSKVPCGGIIESAQLLFWPSDSSMKAYYMAALKAQGPFVFDHQF